MDHSQFTTRQLPEVKALFERTFTESEGEAEGKTLGNLVDNLVDKTESKDLRGYCATDDATITGCIFFSRLSLTGDGTVFMLSPVAVIPEYQGKGVGQNLISYGLDQMKSTIVDFVVTYGDPEYYSKSGFEQISVDLLQPPYPLSFPHGWQAVPLTSQPVASLSKISQGKSQCVDAFRDPALW